MIPGRDKHSYSSLSSLLLKPHEYVLRYGAKLSEGAIRAVSLDNRLKGNLGHKLVECWFQQNIWRGEKIVRSDVERWLHANFDEFALRYALPMLAQGMRAVKHLFLETMTHSLTKLLEHFYEAEVSEVYVEKTLSQGESFGELEGALDLFVLRKSGKWAVIDIKWGSESRYSTELKESRYLQLATYQKL
ncbi:PD-(D/E)XK nuclease family protein [Endozoicomonas sp. 2B-B]